jgi:uncharacterized Tic20 family protein
MEYQIYPVSGEQKLLAAAAHLLYLLGGIGFVIAPLIILILKKNDPFVYEHAKQALVAQLILLIAGAVVSLLCIVLIGFLLIPILMILGVIFVITSLIAAIRVLEGRPYAYPLIQGIIRRI